MLHEDFHKNSPQSYSILIACLHWSRGNEGRLELKAAKLLVFHELLLQESKQTEKGAGVEKSSIF